MNSQLMSIGDIKLNPSNPRVIKDHKFQKLVASIKEFPEMLSVRPIVVNEDMIVLGGNMRLKACIEAGLKEVPVIVTTFDEEKQSQFIIKDNIGFGEWDWDMLANTWDIKQLEDWGLDVLHEQNWNELEYIDEAERPNLRKDNVITVVVPDELLEDISIIEQDIKELVSDKYSGCEVK